MTKNRARKAAVRASKQNNEPYIQARRRILDAPLAPAVPRIITVYAHQGGFPVKLHAIRDLPAARAEMGIGNLVLQAKALCGSRGGSVDFGGWRLTSSHGAAPHAGVDFEPEGSAYCIDCSIAWREQFQPDAQDTKLCQGPCGRIRPTNKFRPHKGRRDGLADRCEECRTAARRAALEAKESARREQYVADRRAVADEWASRISAWQSSQDFKPFTCLNAHLLVPEITERRGLVGLAWRCECGTSEVARPVYQLIAAMEELGQSHPMTVTIE